LGISDKKNLFSGFKEVYRRISTPLETTGGILFQIYWRALYIFIIYGLSLSQCDLISTRGIQISIQGVIFPLDGFRYPFRGLYFHWRDSDIHSRVIFPLGGFRYPFRGL